MNTISNAVTNTRLMLAPARVYGAPAVTIVLMDLYMSGGELYASKAGVAFEPERGPESERAVTSLTYYNGAVRNIPTMVRAFAGPVELWVPTGSRAQIIAVPEVRQMLLEAGHA